jgi:hypothetical protein
MPRGVMWFIVAPAVILDLYASGKPLAVPGRIACCVIQSLCGDSAVMSAIDSSSDPDEFNSVQSRPVWCANISSYALTPPEEDNDPRPAR